MFKCVLARERMKQAGLAEAEIEAYKRAGNSGPFNACFDFSAKLREYLDQHLRELEKMRLQLVQGESHRVVPVRFFQSEGDLTLDNLDSDELYRVTCLTGHTLTERYLEFSKHP